MKFSCCCSLVEQPGWLNWFLRDCCKNKNKKLAYSQQIFVFRQDLESSLDSQVMIKKHQHMFPNKILVKIDDFCEKPGNKSAVFTEFHRLKMNIEDPFTQVEFFGMFSIKTHHFCKKKLQKIFEGCVLESLFTFTRPPLLPKVVAVSVYEKHPKSFLRSGRINLKI
jgi:hypothetical protein